MGVNFCSRTVAWNGASHSKLMEVAPGRVGFFSGRSPWIDRRSQALIGYPGDLHGSEPVQRRHSIQVVLWTLPDRLRPPCQIAMAALTIANAAMPGSGTGVTSTRNAPWV